MSLDLCLKQLHVVHINVFHRIQYIRLLLFYSVIFQSCKFQSPKTICRSIYCGYLDFAVPFSRQTVRVESFAVSLHC